MSTDTLLYSFFRTLDCNSFTIYARTENTLSLLVGWIEKKDIEINSKENIITLESEEFQCAEFDVREYTNECDIIQLLNLLKVNNLMNTDKITVSKSELHTLATQKLNFKEEQFEEALSNMLNIKVPMVDDDKRTDFFFIHF